MPSGSLKIKRPTSSWFVGGGLLGFGLLGLVLLLTVQQTTSTDPQSDFRARAGNAVGIPVTAKVVTVDTAARTLIVDTMKMANSDATLPGNWTATITDTDEDLSEVSSGSTVLLDIDPPSFSVEQRTFLVNSVSVLPQ